MKKEDKFQQLLKAAAQELNLPPLLLRCAAMQLAFAQMRGEELDHARITAQARIDFKKQIHSQAQDANSNEYHQDYFQKWAADYIDAAILKFGQAEWSEGLLNRYPDLINAAFNFTDSEMKKRKGGFLAQHLRRKKKKGK